MENVAQEHETAPILVSSNGPIATVTLNRAAQRNAMSAALVVALIECVARLDCDTEVRAILVRGAGNGFCAGSDLSGLAAMTAAERRMFEEMSGRVARMFGQCRKPVIAAVHGFAIGGGLTLAAACDIVVTEPQSRWSLPEVPVGLFPAWGIAAVTTRIGMPAARRLCFGVEQWDGRQAHAAGLADVLTGDVLDAAEEIAGKLAALPWRQTEAVKRYFSGQACDEAADDRANRLFMEMTGTAEAASTFARFGRNGAA